MHEESITATPAQAKPANKPAVPVSAPEASSAERVLAAGDPVAKRTQAPGPVRGFIRSRSVSFWLFGGAFVISQVAKRVKQRRIGRVDVAQIVAKAEPRQRETSGIHPSPTE